MFFSPKTTVKITLQLYTVTYSGHKNKTALITVLQATDRGLEPLLTESESAVLPLHKPAIFVRSCRTNRYYYTGKQEFVKGFVEKNNICRFQPLSGHFPRKTPAPCASSEADLVIPQVRSGAESAFSLNFIRHQCPAPPCSM